MVFGGKRFMTVLVSSSAFSLAASLPVERHIERAEAYNAGDEKNKGQSPENDGRDAGYLVKEEENPHRDCQYGAYYPIDGSHVPVHVSPP